MKKLTNRQKANLMVLAILTPICIGFIDLIASVFPDTAGDAYASQHGCGTAFITWRNHRYKSCSTTNITTCQMWQHHPVNCIRTNITCESVCSAADEIRTSAIAQVLLWTTLGAGGFALLVFSCVALGIYLNNRENPELQPITEVEMPVIKYT